MSITIKDNLSPNKYQCAKAQTLCKINGQLVQDNMTVIYENEVIPKETYNLADIWNEIQDAMIAAYNLGSKGTRGPDISGLTEQEKGKYTMLEYYNNLLSRLNKTTVSGTQYIKALDFVTNLQQGLLEYQLSDDLCNICNTGCQYCNTCETSAQKCGSCYSGLDCGESGGGGNCSGSSCCMSGNWGCGTSYCMCLD